MAVYTEVPDEALVTFLTGYDLGQVRSFKGIAEGVENSNYLLHADAGQFILTLYEKRVKEGDLPFFIGLMEHLAERGVTCPQPVRAKNGEALGRLAGRGRSIAARWAKRWRACMRRAPTSPSSDGRTRSASRAGRRWSLRPPRAPTRSRPASQTR